MIVTLDTKTRKLHVDQQGAECTQEEVVLHISTVMRAVADKLNPPEVPELIVNEERARDITEAMQYQFMNEHEGEIH